MISVIVITKNEEKMIKACLESVKWADEIIVYDNGSTDKTLEIAKKYTDKVFQYKQPDFATLRNNAMEKAIGEWVLYVDADERVLAPLREEINSLVSFTDKSALDKVTNSAYAIPRKNIIFGTEVNYGPFQHDWVIRLFKKADFESWIGRVHEYGKFKGKLGYAQNFFLHLTHRNIDQVVLKSLEWSKIDANLRLEAGHPKMSGWRFLRILFSELFYQGIIRRGFFSGTIGVIDSISQTFSMFMTYIRLWQLQQSKPTDQIYEDIDKKLLESGFNYP